MTGRKVEKINENFMYSYFLAKIKNKTKVK